jgi:bifunctional non-homologous end joining protein LigD
MFEKLKNHIGHKLTCLGAPEWYQAEKVILFCDTCDTIIIDVTNKTKKKKSNFNMNKYKTHDGEKGSPEQWREAAKVIFNVNNENCLTTLGLNSVPSSKEELKKQYIKLIAKAHPDKGGTEEDAARINAAYKFALTLFFPNITRSPTTRKDTGLRPQLLNPITEEEATRYLDDAEWCIQEKKDGKHGLIEKFGPAITAANKQGLEMGIPKPVEDIVKDLPDVVLDGELINNKVFHVFDLLEHNGEDLRKQTYYIRYTRLRKLIKDQENMKVVKSCYGTKEKTEFFLRMKKEGREGVVFKRMTASFTEGRPDTGGDMVKCKFWASLSAIVDEEKTGKASFISYVLDPKGNRVYLGNCSALGKTTPQAGDIVEIKYLYAYKGGKLIQPVMLEIRDDVAKEDCSTKQLKFKREE